MNDAQKALLAQLRKLVVETPKSGALNRGGRPLYITRFSQAVERRADDGPALVSYIRSKVHEPATGSYDALIEADAAHLSVEALVADEHAPWSSEFTAVDRAAARARLSAMTGAHLEGQQATEGAAVEHDRKIVAQVSRRRVAEGKPLTPAQEAAMLEQMAARRADDS